MSPSARLVVLSVFLAGLVMVSLRHVIAAVVLVTVGTTVGVISERPRSNEP